MKVLHVRRFVVIAGTAAALALPIAAIAGPGTAIASCAKTQYTRTSGGNQNSPNVQKQTDSCSDFNQSANISWQFVGYYSKYNNGPWTRASRGCVNVSAGGGLYVLVSGVLSGTWLHSNVCAPAPTFTGTVWY
jgi:hypothetical protein